MDLVSILFSRLKTKLNRNEAKIKDVAKLKLMLGIIKPAWLIGSEIKAVIVKSGTRLVSITKTITLLSHRNRPRVIRLIGSKKSLMIGFTNILMMVKITPEYKRSRRLDGVIKPKKMVETINRLMEFKRLNLR